MKHTPTPWEIDESDVRDEAQAVLDATGCIVADVLVQGRPGDCEANAAFIVRACNAHEAFVEILRAFLTAYDAGHVELNSPELDGQQDVPPHPWHDEWLHLARAALSKADVKA